MLLNKIYKVCFLSVVALSPVFVFAFFEQITVLLADFKALVKVTIIPIVFAIALLFFFYGIIKYIWSVSSGGKEDGKKIMIWGIVALFVMASVWGLVAFIQTSIGVGAGNAPAIPTFKEPEKSN